jgi:hypothetical protein
VKATAVTVLVVAALVAGATVAIASIGSSSHHAATAHGTHHLVGGIRYEGGPKGSGDGRFEPGTVRLERGSTVVARQKVGEGERYDLRAPVGRYRLSTRLGDWTCSRSVHVRGARTHADLRCQIK